MECHTYVELSMFFVSTIVVPSILHTLPVHHCYIKTLECLLNLIFHIKCSNYMQTILKKSSSPTNYMQFILCTFIFALFNLYVLQDPSIPKSKFLMKGKNDKMYPYDFLLFNLKIYVHNSIVK